MKKINYHSEEVSAINKELRPLVVKMIESIDEKFPPIPRPQYGYDGWPDIRIYRFEFEEEEVILPCDFTEASLKDLGKAYSFCISMHSFGLELLTDFSSRQFLLETVSDNYEKEITVTTAKDLAVTNKRGTVVMPTATEIKGAIGADETLQMYNSTKAFYSVAKLTISNRLSTYDKLIAGISREYKRRDLLNAENNDQTDQ